MNKNLKRVLVTGASLLMMTSVGTGINNINVSARHVRSHRTFRHHKINRRRLSKSSKMTRSELRSYERGIKDNTWAVNNESGSDTIVRLLHHNNAFNKYYIKGMYAQAKKHPRNTSSNDVSDYVNNVRRFLKSKSQAYRRGWIDQWSFGFAANRRYARNKSYKKGWIAADSLLDEGTPESEWKTAIDGHNWIDRKGLKDSNYNLTHYSSNKFTHFRMDLHVGHVYK